MKRRDSYLRPRYARAADANPAHGKGAGARARDADDGVKVTMVELLFDLVFVFAVTQLSHTLLADLGWHNAARVAILLIAVWSVWLYTAWVTNWLDPERVPVRLFLFAMMLVGLVMSASIPQAFAEHARVFAGAYVTMQLARAGFLLWALRRERANLARNAQRILVWELARGAIWLAGGWSDPDTRLACWSAAIALGFIMPWINFWVPGMGRSEVGDWDIDGRHVAERCGLFVIIALGESLLITGATFSQIAWNAGALWGFAAAAVGSLALWWIYFDRGAEHAAEVIASAQNPGATARAAYTAIHLLIVAGIIVCAVADEEVLARPAHAGPAAATAILLGPALFLLGTALFKWVVYERKWPPLSHVLGLLLLLALVPAAALHWLSALGLGIATTGVLLFVLAWEYAALRN